MYQHHHERLTMRVIVSDSLDVEPNSKGSGPISSRQLSTRKRAQRIGSGGRRFIVFFKGKHGKMVVDSVSTSPGFEWLTRRFGAFTAMLCPFRQRR